MPNRGWNDLGPKEKAVYVGLSLVQLSLLAAALMDIYRRPAGEMRGERKLPWAALSFVNFVGPISYFVFGRKK